MTHVILCDDDEMILSKVENLIREYQTEKCCHEKINICKFNNPEKLLREYAKNDGILIFLAIGMKPITGLELAKRIRRIDNKSSIVFLTGFNNYTQTAFDVHAFQYLLKPVTKEKIWKVLHDYFKHKQEHSEEAKEYFTFKNTSNDIHIEMDLILYFEKYRNQTTIVLETNTIEIYATLKQIESQLPPYFLQCHKSYVVNMKKVIKRERDKCILKNGQHIPIGRAKQNEFKMFYTEYLKQF